MKTEYKTPKLNTESILLDTESTLSPGHPEVCAGGVPENCLCDECDYLMDCVPDWEKPIPYNKKEEEKAIKRLDFLLSKI